MIGQWAWWNNSYNLEHLSNLTERVYKNGFEQGYNKGIVEGILYSVFVVIFLAITFLVFRKSKRKGK